MKTRLHYAKAAPGVYEAMDALDRYVMESGLEKRIVLLIQLRASQINGCAYCLDSHSKDLVAMGEPEQRLFTLPAWRECSYYTDRERAALEWTEAVTRIEGHRVPDSIYETVRPHFTEKELCDLTLAVAAINAWNRLSISARLTPPAPAPTASVAG